jgi:hypothetical protein
MEFVNNIACLNEVQLSLKKQVLVNCGRGNTEFFFFLSLYGKCYDNIIVKQRGG